MPMILQVTCTNKATPHTSIDSSDGNPKWWQVIMISDVVVEKVTYLCCITKSQKVNNLRFFRDGLPERPPELGSTTGGSRDVSGMPPEAKIQL